MIIDTQNLIIGRMAAFVAKKSLLGEKIDIVNCEKAVVTGTKREVLTRYKRKASRTTPASGPFFPKQPDRFVRRIVRGMLPYKKHRGETAFKNVKCHIGIPVEFKDKKPITIKEANIENSNSPSYVTVKDICAHLGGKV